MSLLDLMRYVDEAEQQTRQENTQIVSAEDMLGKMERGLAKAYENKELPLWMERLRGAIGWLRICFADMYGNKSMVEMHEAATALIQSLLTQDCEVVILAEQVDVRDLEFGYRCTSPEDPVIPILMRFTHYIAIRLGFNTGTKKRKTTQE